MSILGVFFVANMEVILVQKFSGRIRGLISVISGFYFSIIGLFMDYVAVIIKALKASCAQEFCTKRDDEGEISTVKIARS